MHKISCVLTLFFLFFFFISFYSFFLFLGEGGVSLVEMLYCTSLIALVGSGDHPSFSPRRLRIYNTKTEKYICELNFLSTILNIKMNYKRLCVILENKIHIFETNTMKIQHTIDTTSNPTGICTLSGSNDPHSTITTYMCYPASEEKGEIFVYDAQLLQVVGCIRAHNTRIRCCSLNQQGSLLATCSQQGTVIRVFSVPAGKKLFTFRRGTYPAKINSIHFNRRSDMMVVSSSDSSTVHVFSMKELVEKKKQTNK
jgi:autophagy-related protein 18